MGGAGKTAGARSPRRILYNKDKFTFEEWARAAFDTYVIEAETEIPKLWDAYRALEKSDPPRAAKLARPITELREWDHVRTAQSVPLTLFTLWFPQHSLDSRTTPD